MRAYLAAARLLLEALHMLNAQPRTAPRSLARLCTDRRGAMSVEYLILTMVGITIAAALGLLGVGMVDGYSASLQILYSEYP